MQGIQGPIGPKGNDGTFNGSGILPRNYADNNAAILAGLTEGDVYHTDGVLKIVISM
jgi:hypothetical protein